jgi:hypothetical protein
MMATGPRIYPIGAAAAVAFIVWGSLFPFVFHPIPLAEAIDPMELIVALPGRTLGAVAARLTRQDL